MSITLTTMIAALPFLGMLAISIVHNHYSEDRPENARQPSFISKHGKTIVIIGNVFLLFWIGFLFYINMLLPVDTLYKVLAEKHHLSNFAVRCVISTFLAGMIMFTGLAGAFAGCLSVFQYHITRKKRIVLLIICFLPAFLTIANIIIQPQFSLFSTDSWLIIKLGFLYSFFVWLFNGTTIIFGKHFLTLASVAAKKLSPKKYRKISPDS